MGGGDGSEHIWTFCPSFSECLAMFWFAPKLPVSPEQKSWVDRRAAWLIEEFGAERILHTPVVLPTPTFFPDRFEGKEADVGPMLRRVCTFMGVDPSRVEIYFYSTDDPELGPGFHLAGDRKTAAGLYHHGQTAHIGIARSQICQPMSLVATLAHELGHVLLLGDERISSEEEDHEPLTDLLTIFLGLGIFGANSAVSESNESLAGWHRWSISRLGYLAQPMWGYGLAVFAHHRGDSRPMWTRHLRPDIRTAFKSSLRWLERQR